MQSEVVRSLLTEKRVKRWIIDLYRIIHRPRIVMATKTERSFIFYLKFIPVVCPSSELSILRFFFPFSIFQPFGGGGHLLTPLVNQSLPTYQSGGKELVSEPVTCTLKMLMEEAAGPLN